MDTTGSGAQALRERDEATVAVREVPPVTRSTTIAPEYTPGTPDGPGPRNDRPTGRGHGRRDALVIAAITLIAAIGVITAIATHHGSKAKAAPAPTAAAPAVSPTQQATEQIRTLVKAAWAAEDQAGNDSAYDLNGLANYFGGVSLTNTVSDIQSTRDAHETGSGNSVLVGAITVTNLVLPGASDPTPATGHVSYCIDISANRLVDASGKDVTPARAGNFIVQTDVVTNAMYPANGWRITDGVLGSKLAASCAG